MTAATVPATCRHGVVGFCFDEATPAQREHVAFLHAHAFDFASAGGTVRTDDAEEYAAHVVATYFDADLDEVPSHTTMHAAWRARA